MAKKLVVAYFMHETERERARPLMASPEVTDSFLVGEVDDADLERLRQTGVIVQELEEAGTPVERGGPAGATVLHPLGIGSGGAFSGAGGGLEMVATPALVDYYFVRLIGPLIESWRERLQGLGVTLLESVPGRGYKTRLRIEQVPTVSSLGFVRDVTWISPEESAPRIATEAATFGPGQASQSGRKMLTFDVRLHAPEDRSKIEKWLADRHVAMSGSSGRKIRFFLLEDSSVLVDLARLPEVDMVAEYVEPKLWNDAARRLLGIDAPLGHNPATLLTQDGAGQIVAVADTGIDDQHPDFAGRIIGKKARGRPGDASDPNGHGTHVAGSVLGDGAASGGQIKGTAPKAQLFFQSLLDVKGRLGGLPLDLNELFDEAYLAGARIHNNSWGAATASTYTINSEEVDEFVRTHPDMLIVIAAGNEGTALSPRKATPGFVDWLSIGSPASCKNALTVGASRSDRSDGALSGTTWGAAWPNFFPNPPISGESVSGDPSCLAAFSSRGPCDDRRIKPDVVAPGTDIASTKSSLAPIGNFWGPYPTPPGTPNNPNYAFEGGTSMATPLVSGCAALIRQYYVNDRTHVPSAALLKATIINSATWLSGRDATAPTAGTPNYHQGHGRVSMQWAIPNPSEPGLALQFRDDWQNSGLSFSVTGQRRRFQFTLPSGAPELRICLAYTDAPARALQNNLNLMVQHLESAQKWVGNADLPNALTSPDPDNNVERVRIENPAAGNYLIQVFVGNMLKPPQDFALVVTGVGVPALTEI